MVVFLGLLTALAYGSSDFAAGLGGRMVGGARVSLGVQLLAMAAALIGLLWFPVQAVTMSAIGWGAMAGVGSAVGTLSLYRGLAVGQMSVVAPISGVISAALPVAVGLLGGDQLSASASAGLLIALPAIVLVSLQNQATASSLPTRATGIWEGALSGIGFGLLFTSIDHAGTQSGTWPLVIGLALASLIVWPLARRSAWPDDTASQRRAWRAILISGGLAGLANLLFLAATRTGQLSIVAILTALYPAVTILLARLILGEQWNGKQKLGLAAAAVAVFLIARG